MHYLLINKLYTCTCISASLIGWMQLMVKCCDQPPLLLANTVCCINDMVCHSGPSHVNNSITLFRWKGHLWFTATFQWSYKMNLERQSWPLQIPFLHPNCEIIPTSNVWPWKIFKFAEYSPCSSRDPAHLPTPPSQSRIAESTRSTQDLPLVSSE